MAIRRNLFLSKKRPFLVFAFAAICLFGLGSCEDALIPKTKKDAKPCYGDPCFHPQLAPQRSSTWNGARWGKTRFYASGEPKLHRGLDLWMPLNSNLYMMYDGYILEIGESPDFGRYIRYLCNVGDEHLVVMYAHIKRAVVIEGAVLEAGKAIAISGETGNLKEAIEGGYVEPHMHLEVRKYQQGRSFYEMEDLNPEDYLGTELSYTGLAKIKRPCHSPSSK